MGRMRRVELWHGHRLIGGDGTRLNLPDTEELRAHFGVHRNQHLGTQNDHMQATAVVLHDLLNDLGLRSVLGTPKRFGKEFVV